MSDIPLRSLKGRKFYRKSGYQALNAEEDNVSDPSPVNIQAQNRTRTHANGDNSTSRPRSSMTAARSAATAAASSSNARKKGKARQQYYPDNDMEEEEETLLRREPDEEEVESATTGREGSVKSQSTAVDVGFLIIILRGLRLDSSLQRTSVMAPTVTKDKSRTIPLRPPGEQHASYISNLN